MSDQPELVMCDRCKDDFACGLLIVGRAVCRGCVFAVCNELLREQSKPAVGPATRDAVAMIQHSLTNEHRHYPSGDIVVGMKAERWYAFLAELEADA